MSSFSIHHHAHPFLLKLVEHAEELRLKVTHTEQGTTLIDGGIETQGSLEAGRQIAILCLAGLGRVGIQYDDYLSITVQSSQAVLACLGSQYAGWGLKKNGFFSMASGPARLLARKEPLFNDWSYFDTAQYSYLILESDKLPPQVIIDKVVQDTKVLPQNLTFILTPITSLTGIVQVSARVLETALHKAHTLKFPLDAIIDGIGNAPIPPCSPNSLTSMGICNDAILFGGKVQLWVDSNDDDAKHLANTLPSETSPDFGKPFVEIFSKVGGDFYQIDPLLFAPARVTVNSLKTGRTFEAGKIHHTLLRKSLFLSV